MIILYIVLVYLLTGMLFAVVFLVKLIHTLDDAVSLSPWTFRLIIFPGCVVMWPVLLRKYMKARKSSRHD